MKSVRTLILAIVIVFVSLALNAGHAFAMTPEQRVLYDAWYQARFGTPTSQPVPSQPAPSQPAPAPPATPQPTTPPTVSGGSIQPVQPNALEQGILDLLNQQRVKSGFAPVRLDAYISAVARVKAEDMIKNNYYGHGSSYGYSGTMLGYFGISVRLSRENICQANSAQVAHNQFMGSSSHRENMLKAWWTDVGISVVRKPGSSLYYVVEIFVQK